ncbi:hypothetical protein [Vibrio ulleungensis]|uniref:Uncharacterized protein n=1 Tax=Vibrio ulleungensis TaxID=2807619 RepID=A0ABS2HFP4_9VIBR|nr:hypothetical protein [Vibrio ulleungensis]MBM7036363.1 hypothetical protein [Vibrio ulleungensis]
MSNSCKKLVIESIYETVEVKGTFMMERRYKHDRRNSKTKVAYDRRTQRDKRIPDTKSIDEHV